MAELALVGDIGGTNSRFGLVEPGSTRVSRVAVQVKHGAASLAAGREKPPVQGQSITSADRRVFVCQPVVARPFVHGAVRVIEEGVGEGHGRKRSALSFQRA